MIRNKRRYAFKTVIGITFACLAGCADTTGSADASAPAATTPNGTDVAEAIQAQMLPAIETTFAARNAKARLEGDVVHVRMDGDASAAMAGFSDCRVLTQLVRDTERVVLEFPGGDIDCTALLGSP